MERVEGSLETFKYLMTAMFQPSYYFTHGRKGVCGISSSINFVILEMMGYSAINIGNSDHAWCEAFIDGEIYVVNFNEVRPREGLFETSGWTITTYGYDPDWYLK